MIDGDDYKLRISSATPAQLVMINYELIIAFAEEALVADNALAYEKNIDMAKNWLNQLIGALNMDISVSHDLYQIYEYINQLLVTAYFGHNKDSASEAINLLKNLHTGWREIADFFKDAKPVMENTPQVYVGLTYEKDGLAEYIDRDGATGYHV